MNKDIIRIAEAMGWIYTKGERISPLGHRDPFNTWHMRGEDKLWNYLPFNPLTSHDDCHALIEWLNGRGFDVDRTMRKNRGKHSVRIGSASTIAQFWDGDDYRIGVVELTLKILDESDE